MNDQFRNQFMDMAQRALKVHRNADKSDMTDAERDGVAAIREFAVRSIAVIDLLQHEADEVARVPVVADGYAQADLPVIDHAAASMAESFLFCPMRTGG
jgi:hypothetical protein